MKALVIGATGATGKELVNQLLQNPNYNQVVVLVRRQFFVANSKLTEVIVDFNELDNYSEYFFADVAFSCLGTTLKSAGSKKKQWKVDYDYQYNFAKICKQNNVPKFVLISAMGANSKSIFFYNKLKGALEEAIIKLNFRNLIIMQPGSLIRPESDRLGENFSVKLLIFLNKLGLLSKFRPLLVNDLAKAMQISVDRICTDSVVKYNLSKIYKILKL